MTSPHAASTAPAVDTSLDGSTPAEPLHHYLERRRRAGSRFSAGEAVTLTVGLLRGCARLRDRSGRICWWLTDDGRPLALPDDDATDAIGETLDVLTAVDALCEPSGSAVVARCRDAVAALSPRFWDEVERRAFAAAEPEPLVLGPFFPQASAPDAPGDHAVESAPPLLPLVDADLATVLRRALGDLRARWLRLPVRSKRLVGAGATAVVLTAVVVALTVSVPGRADESRGAGARPPAEATSPVTADEDGSSIHGPAGRGAGDEGIEATADSGATADAAWRGRGDDAAQERADDSHQGSAGDATAGHPGEGEPTAVAEARRLLAADLACGGDDDCRGAIWERPPATPVEIDPARARLSLVDDFGGLAVVRVDADAHARHITLVRTDDEWLVRDVRIVTDQPS